MAERESTAVGYRLRMQPPGGLSTYPDAVKLMWFQWVVELGLARKDRELAKGMDKNGKIGVLSPKTIKHRKSEVGPTTATAPFLTPSYARSRVRSLLTGRAHTSSAEFWWAFDAVSGRSFAKILHYLADGPANDHRGFDVFGLSDAGVAWVTREASKKWVAWLAEGHHGRPAVSPVGVPIRKVAVLKPVPKIPLGYTNLEMTTGGAGSRESATRAAIAAGEHTGFRRLNLPGEKWKPYPVVKVPLVKARAAMGPAKAPPAPVVTLPPVKPIPTLAVLTLEVFGRKALAAARLVPESQRYNYAKTWIVDAWEQFRKAYPDVTLEEFKAQLWQAHQAGKIELARADTPGWGGAAALAKDRASKITVADVATFEVIRVD